MAALTIRSDAPLAAESRELLIRIGGLPWVSDFYLAGSAGLALYLGHRPVRDLDLMSPVQRLRSIDRRDLLEHLLAIDEGVRVETARDGFFYVRSGAGVGVRLYYYPYPLIGQEEALEQISVASAIDLGLMKLGAVISRGTRRDFVDLFLLCRELPLVVLLDHANDKFGHVGDFPLQAFKGLADLSQIDGEPMPILETKLEWNDIESWLKGEVRDLARQYVGLERM